MAITDLLDRVPFPPAPQGDGEAARSDAPDDGRLPTVEIEFPPVGQVGGLNPVALPPAFAPIAERAHAEAPPRPATVPGGVDGAPATPRARGTEALPPLPSWGVAVVGGLSLLCLALIAALAIVIAEPEPGLEATAVGTPSDATPSGATPPEAGAPTETAPVEASPEPLVSPASFPAEPVAIPVELLTRLEAASGEALDVELERLLEALQFGFGRRSAQLEPTLRSYVYRMGSRFEWNPDTFRVAVTAPDPALAAARAALLERLFEDAVASGRLDVGTGIGPHALTLVSE